ncbi:hypothetical protein ASG42_28180 [Rhizobium sp. Leaf391]|nr:hypothetical protein ASG42_28180 [Rhizobium sp. Leaf391]
MITDVLEFRLHPYAIIGTAVHLGGRFLATKALTTDIRAVFWGHVAGDHIASKQRFHDVQFGCCAPKGANQKLM